MKKVFIDTNVLIYAYSEDEPNKSKLANKIIFSNKSIISTQVINELSNILYKKFNLTAPLILKLIDELEENLEIVNFSINTIKLAHNIKEKYKYSYYDSLIIATALENNCLILYSEDMQHNQTIENQLKIINPFKK